MGMQEIYECWDNASGNAIEWKKTEVNVVRCCGGASKIERKIFYCESEMNHPVSNILVGRNTYELVFQFFHVLGE